MMLILGSLLLILYLIAIVVTGAWILRETRHWMRLAASALYDVIFQNEAGVLLKPW